MRNTNNQTNRFRTGGFTLIELLVVIAIIAILAAILFPVFARAKESAQVTTAISSAKQVNTAVLLYANDNSDAMPFSGIDSLIIDVPSIGTSEWQESIFPYAKSEAIYRIPSDRTEMVRKFTGANGCQFNVANRAAQYSASSWLMNPVTTRYSGTNIATVTRNTITSSEVVSPSNFFLLVNGQRPTLGSATTGKRFAADPKDHNGDSCSLWLAVYSLRTRGGAGLLINPDREYDARSAPHFDRGLIFGMFDSSTKFYSVSTKNTTKGTDQAVRSLEGRLPWCKTGELDPNNANCYTKWNAADLN